MSQVPVDEILRARRGKFHFVSQAELKFLSLVDYFGAESAVANPLAFEVSAGLDELVDENRHFF